MVGEWSVYEERVNKKLKIDKSSVADHFEVYQFMFMHQLLTILKTNGFVYVIFNVRFLYIVTLLKLRNFFIIMLLIHCGSQHKKIAVFGI